jgi:hypothetical protein
MNQATSAGLQIMYRINARAHCEQEVVRLGRQRVEMWMSEGEMADRIRFACQSHDT